MIEESDLEVGTETIPRRAAGLSLSQWLEAAPGRFLLLFTVIYFLAEYCSNRHRVFWQDELITYYLANLPSIRDIWPLIKQGIELNPPLPFWITWVVHHSMGRGEFITRLPAITGFWGMCVCLFYYVRRRSDATHGFLALLLPLFTYTAQDATWARGYGLLLGFSSAALLSWQFAIDGIKRRFAIPALSICLAAAVSCHYYAVYSAGAILLGELIRTWRRRRADIPVIAAIVLGAGTLAVYLPLLRAARSGSKTFWISPQVRFLYESYADLFGPAAMVLLLFLALVLLIPEKQRNWATGALGIHEVAACLVLAAMPLVIFVSTIMAPIPFYSRYVQPVVIGFTVLVSMFVYRVGGNNERFRNIGIALIVWLCFAPWTLWQLSRAFSPPPWITVQGQLPLPEKGSPLPIAIDNDNVFMSAYHYAPQEIKDHLYFLTDRESSIKYLGSDTGEHSLILGQTFHDFHVVKYDDFVRRFPEFLVARPRAGGWVLQRLLEDGADIRLVRLEKEHGVFVEDRQLFRVKVPQRNGPADAPQRETGAVTR